MGTSDQDTFSLSEIIQALQNLVRTTTQGEILPEFLARVAGQHDRKKKLKLLLVTAHYVQALNMQQAMRADSMGEAVQDEPQDLLLH
ncbi:MAG: hypothetical protein WA840_10210 [Caulobacteraceae bacterium]